MRKPKQTHGLTNLGTGPRNKGRSPHADDFAVEDFAHVMKGKLAQKRDEGRGGWESKEGCSAEFLSQLLREHVEKGDPVDVANFCMMLHQRGERICPVYTRPQPASTALVERRLISGVDAALSEVLGTVPMETRAILDEALKSLNFKHDWHIRVATVEQWQELPEAIRSSLEQAK